MEEPSDTVASERPSAPPLPPALDNLVPSSFFGPPKLSIQPSMPSVRPPFLESRKASDKCKVPKDTDVLLKGIEAFQDFALFSLNVDGRVSTWNNGAKNIQGYEAAEIIGEHFSIFHTPQAIADRYPERELELAAKKGRFEDEGWRVRKDGTCFWARVVISAIFEGDQLRGYLKMTRDLTEQRNTEQRLRVLERGVSEIKDYAIFLLSPEGYVMTWNAGAQHIKGYTAAEAIGKHFSMFYTPYDIQRRHPENELRLAVETGRFEDLGWRVKKDGKRFWANVVITAIFDEEGKHVGFSKVTRDLTERRLAEKKLHTLEMGTSEVKDYAVFLLDVDGTIQTWNRGAELTFGLEPSVAINTSFLSLCKELEELGPQLLSTSGKGGIQRIERQWHRRDGVAIWANISTSLIMDEGLPSGFIVVAHDLTERKKLEEERFNALLKAELEQKRAEDAKKHEKLQRDFTDRICHEVRNPLNGINGNVELIIKNLKKIESSLDEFKRKLKDKIMNLSLLDVDIEQTVKTIEEEAEAIAECSEYQRRITDEVLCLSAIESRGLILSQHHCDPKAIAESVARMHRASCERKGIRLLLTLPNGTVRFFGDTIHIEQVLINLVSNAIKYTSKGGTIYLTLERASVEGMRYLQFSVKDTGCGMTDRELSKLFQRYAHGKATGYKEQPGSGLGLIISKHLVEAMGGHLQVESKPGEGTAFSFLLPLSEDIEDKQEEDSLEADGLHPNKRRRTDSVTRDETKRAKHGLLPMSDSIPDWSLKRVLVVDDSVINQKVVAGMLARTGCACEVAGDGQMAVQLVEKSAPFDLILMDLTMPVMNGFEATRFIRTFEDRQGRTPCPIIALSGYTQERERHAAKVAGMNDYLSKPIRSAELYKKLSAFLPASLPQEATPQEDGVLMETHVDGAGSQLVRIVQ